jgi:vitamin B12 transporter
MLSQNLAVKNSPDVQEDKTSITASGTVGEFGLRTINAGTFLQRKKVAVSAGIVSNNADGVQQRGTKGYFANNTASASINYLISPEWNVALRSSFDHRDFAAQNFYTTFASDTASEKVKTFWNQVKVGYQKEKTALSFDAGYKFVQDNYLYNPISIENSSKSQLWQGLFTWKQSFNETTSLISGLNYQHKNIASNDRGNHSLHQLAPFLSFSKLFGERFTVSPSVRADWRETIGTEVVPQLTLSYKLAGWQLRGSAGKTIRDADFTERYNNYNKALVTGGSVGNPNLKAERSFSYEIGADWFLQKSLKVSLTAFRRQQKDLIDYVTTPYAAMPRKENLSPTGSFALAQNLASVNTSGVEADIHYLKMLSATQKLWFNAGVTWLDTESGNAAPSFYVSSHAKFLVNFATLYSCGRFSFGINGLHKTRAAREVSAIEAKISKSYFVVNAKVDYAIIQNILSVFVQADNLSNTKYSDLLGAQMPGRWLMGGVKYAFLK